MTKILVFGQNCDCYSTCTIYELYQNLFFKMEFFTKFFSNISVFNSKYILSSDFWRWVNSQGYQKFGKIRFNISGKIESKVNRGCLTGRLIRVKLGLCNRRGLFLRSHSRNYFEITGESV